MNKYFIFALFAVLLVSFASAGFFDGLRSGLGLSPPGSASVGGDGSVKTTSGSSFVNANSCNADSVCEATTFYSDNAEFSDLDVTGVSDLKGDVFLRILSVSTTPNLSANGYVCVNAAGLIYRSATPCASTGHCRYFDEQTVNAVGLRATHTGEGVLFKEGERIYKGNAVPLLQGSAVEFDGVTNISNGYIDDEAGFSLLTDSSVTYVATITGEGVGNVIIGGVQYGLRYGGSASSSASDRWVTLDYPGNSDNEFYDLSLCF